MEAFTSMLAHAKLRHEVTKETETKHQIIDTETKEKQKTDIIDTYKKYYTKVGSEVKYLPPVSYETLTDEKLAYLITLKDMKCNIYEYIINDKNFYCKQWSPDYNHAIEYVCNIGSWFFKANVNFQNDIDEGILYINDIYNIISETSPQINFRINIDKSDKESFTKMVTYDTFEKYYNAASKHIYQLYETIKKEYKEDIDISDVTHSLAIKKEYKTDFWISKTANSFSIKIEYKNSIIQIDQNVHPYCDRLVHVAASTEKLYSEYLMASKLLYNETCEFNTVDDIPKIHKLINNAITVINGEYGWFDGKYYYNNITVSALIEQINNYNKENNYEKYNIYCGTIYCEYHNTPIVDCKNINLSTGVYCDITYKVEFTNRDEPYEFHFKIHKEDEKIITTIVINQLDYNNKDNEIINTITLTGDYLTVINQFKQFIIELYKTYEMKIIL